MLYMCKRIARHVACSSRANFSATVADLCVCVHLYTCVYAYVHVLYVHTHRAARCLQLVHQLLGFFCHQSVCMCAFIYMYM